MVIPSMRGRAGWQLSNQYLSYCIPVFSSTLMRFISQKCTTDVMKRRVHTNQILNMIRIEPPPRRLISESIPKAPPLLPSNPVRSKTYRRAYTFLVAGMASIVGLLAMCIVEPHLHLRRERAARQARIATRVKERMACSLREDYATKDENVDREARVLTALALLPLVDTDHQRQALDYLCTVSASLGGVDEIERAGGVPILLDLAGSLCYSPHRMLLMQLLARLSALPSVPPCIIQSANDSTLTGLSAVKNIPLSVFKTEIATASHFAADDTQELSNRQRALEREDLRRLRMLQVSLIPGDRCMEHIVTQTKKRLSAARSVKRQEKEGRFQMGEDMFTAVTSASSSPDSMLHGTCLQSLALLSTVDENRKKIVDGGGLGILMDAHRFPPHDITEEEKLENRIEIARILANLALDGQVTGPIIRSGWLGVLKEWVGSGYMKLESEATRALANLDTMAIAARRKELEDVEHEASTPMQYILNKARQGWPLVVTSLGTRMHRLGFPSSGSLDNPEPIAATPVYKDGVYLLYAPQITKEEMSHHNEPNIDIVFVHGLLGGTFYTWRQAECHDHPDRPIEMSWPRAWLPESLPEARVLSVEYDTQVTDWAAICPAVPATVQLRTLKKRGEMLLEKLEAAGVGDRPVVFVAHSMGGLLVKSMLVEAAGKGGPMSHKLLSQTRGIVFLATPHRGSFLANYFSGKNIMNRILMPSIEVNELEANSPQLEQLDSQFAKLANSIRCLSFGEMISTRMSWAFSALVVPAVSANPGYGAYEEYNVDHLNICKLRSQTDTRYVRIVKFIRMFLPKQKDYNPNEIFTGRNPTESIYDELSQLGSLSDSFKAWLFNLYQ